MVDLQIARMTTSRRVRRLASRVSWIRAGAEVCAGTLEVIRQQGRAVTGLIKRGSAAAVASLRMHARLAASVTAITVVAIPAAVVMTGYGRSNPNSGQDPAGATVALNDADPVRHADLSLPLEATVSQAGVEYQVTHVRVSSEQPDLAGAAEETRPPNNERDSYLIVSMNVVNRRDRDVTFTDRDMLVVDAQGRNLRPIEPLTITVGPEASRQVAPTFVVIGPVALDEMHLRIGTDEVLVPITVGVLPHVTGEQ